MGIRRFLFVFLLFLNFVSLKFNIFNVAHPHAINILNSLESTALVIGRIVKSREDGIFSKSGFPGHYKVPKKIKKIPKSKYQYLLFKNKVVVYPNPKFLIYKSQIGGQGIFFSALDWGLRGFVSPDHRLFLYNSISAGFLSILLTIVVLWLIQFYGYTAGIFSQLIILLSPQLIIFGDNIWWQPWSYYFPLVLLLLIHKRLFIASLVGFSVKFFFTGYEYITTMFFILFVPIVIKTIYNNEEILTFIKKIIIVGGGFFVALGVSLLVLFYQHSVESGSFKHGYDHVVKRFAIRTDGTGFKTSNTVLNASFDANYKSVLNKYLAYPAIDARQLFEGKNKKYLTCRSMVYWLLAMTVVSALFWKKFHRFRHRLFSLLAGTWIALFGALSWIIIFKAHSYIHQFHNRIVFHMPFSILLAALFGFQLFLIFKWMIDYGNSRLHSHLQ